MGRFVNKCKNVEGVGSAAMNDKEPLVATTETAGNVVVVSPYYIMRAHATGGLIDCQTRYRQCIVSNDHYIAGMWWGMEALDDAPER